VACGAELCGGLFRLRGELASAKEAAELDTRRQALRAEIRLREQGAE
jgi:hypothetical protein